MLGALEGFSGLEDPRRSLWCGYRSLWIETGWTVMSHKCHATRTYRNIEKQLQPMRAQTLFMGPGTLAPFILKVEVEVHRNMFAHVDWDIQHFALDLTLTSREYLQPPWAGFQPFKSNKIKHLMEDG